MSTPLGAEALIDTSPERSSIESICIVYESLKRNTIQTVFLGTFSANQSELEIGKHRLMCDDANQSNLHRFSNPCDKRRKWISIIFLKPANSKNFRRFPNFCFWAGDHQSLFLLNSTEENFRVSTTYVSIYVIRPSVGESFRSFGRSLSYTILYHFTRGETPQSTMLLCLH